MKKIIIILSIFFIATAFVYAQDVQTDEQNTVQSENIEEDIIQPEAEKVEEAVTEEAEKTEEKVTEAVKPKAEKKTEAKAKEKTSKEYLADLSGNNENDIVAAAEWLGDKGEKSAVPRLIDLLKSDKRARVRLYSSMALGLIADESSIPALNEALTGDSNADVRYSVLLSIHRINPAKSLDAIKKAKETESDPYIKDYIEKMEAKWNEKK